jgi:beta-galactosidase/beta-glucuronidase
MKQLYTIWGENLDPNHVLSEYPRPTMKRKSYQNLNGYWNYAITESRDFPTVFDGKILVPFSPESVLSGVSRQVLPEEYLYYRREIEIHESFYQPASQRLLLHFGAVDQIAEVYINGLKVCKHVGGYLPFHVDISDAVKRGTNHLSVRVKDYTDTSYHSRGKQKINRGGMWYTPQSGIWQTVWMESVPKNYIERVKFTPYYDDEEISVGIFSNEKIHDTATISILANQTTILKRNIVIAVECRIKIPGMVSWSPENPFLYDVSIEYDDDKVSSYFAMRKTSIGRDGKGILRFMLNNQPYFHHGLLDQGYWSDGMYTPPSDEAMRYDILKMKELGFNTLRKHIKIESARWYYHCDKIGMLVWQDMVNGGGHYNSLFLAYFPSIFTTAARKVKDNAYKRFGRESKEGRLQFYKEMKETVLFLYNHPSLVLWVPFNEGWGQFDAKKATKYIRKLDSTRLINEASGWFDQGGGDVFSIHNYFRKLKVKPNEKRVVAVTEYGGFAHRIDEHSYHNKIYGYRKYDSKEMLTKAFCGLLKSDIIGNVDKGLSAAIYTQVSDIEEEVNGILTYDRKVVKVKEEMVKRWNKNLLYKTRNL